MERSEDASPELIWAKFSRYPWWPAFVVARCPEDTVEVEFFGTFERSALKDSFVRAFAQPPPFEPKTLRSKGLQAAIASAWAVCEGSSTVEQERDKARRGARTPSPGRLSIALARVGAPPPASDTAQSDAASAVNVRAEGAEPFEEKSVCEAPGEQPHFHALHAQLHAAMERVGAPSEAFPEHFEQFCAVVRALLEPCHAKELTASNVGRTLMQCKAQLQGAELPKDTRRRALYELTSLITLMKRRLVEYFFAQDEPGGEAVSERVIALVAAANEEETPAAHTSSRLAARKPSEGEAVEEPKERFKLPAEVKSRVLKKFFKFFSQFSAQKLPKSDAEKLARLVHQNVIDRSESLLHYKRGVISVVHNRAQLEDFFAARCSPEHRQSLESTREDLLQLLFK